MKKPVKNTFTLLAIPLVVAWSISGQTSNAQTVPRANAYGTYKPEYTKSAPTKPGEIPQHIDTYTPGKMPLKPLEIPTDVQARLAALSPEQVEFLKSGKTAGIVGTQDLFARVRKSASTDELKAYVDAIISVYEQVQFHPGEDPDRITLNTASPSFNKWRLRRPAGLDPKREPGPVSLSRYVGGRGGALPTFAGAPVAFTSEDLKAGKVDVAIMGAPLNMGSGWRDADHAPTAMRLDHSAGGTDVFSMLDPGQVLNIVDYGDVAVDQLNTDRSVQEVRRVVREVAQAGSIPFVIGGDHSLEYPNVAAMADVYGKGNVGVVHFDSHLDTGRGRVHLLDHGQPIYRVMKEGHIRPEDYIQVGLRAHYTKDYYDWERLIGMNYHTMAEVERRGWPAVMERVLNEAKKHTKYLYVSFDVDVLDPAVEPGTGTPVPGGLTMREAIPIVRRLCAETRLVGFDIVEVAPQLDPTYRSAMNANALMHACLSGVAMRKKGLTQPWYVSPLTSDHGQDNYFGDKK